MRITLLMIAAAALFMAGCMPISTVPPQDTTVWGPEPVTIMLSEMTTELGWTYETGPGPYDYTMRSPQGDQVIFTIGSDVFNINGTRWRQEYDAIEKRRGTDLKLPVTTHNFICKHFEQHHLVREPDNGGANVEYTLEPLTPAGDTPKENVKIKGATSTVLKGLTICIDAGHGGTDPGGIGSGVSEKDVVLPVSLMLRDLCVDASAEVIMTRTTDVYPDLDQRVNVANKANVDLFVSIHANIAPGNGDVTGFEVFYNSTSDSGRSAAQKIVSAMDAATDAPNRGAKEDPRGLRVLEKTKMTAVLVELGFLSNAGEAKRLTQKDYQTKMAKAVFEGVVNYHTKGKAAVSK